MVKPGEVVEFKAGLFGIQPPANLAILLDRYRQKGVPWVRVVTVEGRKELKQEHLSRRIFKQRYAGDLRNEAEVVARLRHLISLHGGGQLLEEAEDDLGRLEEALWEATCDDARAYTEGDLAKAHYGPDASPQQRKDTSAALARCRRRGTGRFENAGRGDVWRPWSRQQASAMRSAWQDLQRLRQRMVLVEETEEGRTFARQEIDAQTRSDEAATLAWVKAAMVQFIEHDGVPQNDEPIAGIGGLGAVQVFGMDLHLALGRLAMDWIHSGHTTTSSDYVHFLLETGLWSADDAVEGLMRRHVNQEPFFSHRRDEKAAAMAADLPEPDLSQDPDRTDLRHLTCYTIDPPDAKDFDDAVGIEEPGGGRTRLWVHIADVSHYVRPGTALDKHAKDRATSVYLPGRVLPMLPHRIADHLCSLRDDGDRFALSAALDVDGDGKLTAAAFYKSIIRVTQNLRYGDALARRDEPGLAGLFALATRMQGQRRGIALETGELKVLLEESGFSALEKRADDATRMIETFMVAANEAVARHLADHDVPLLFRCHPLPDATRAERFRHQLATMGFAIDLELPAAAQREAMQADTGMNLLEQLKQGGGKLELFGGGMGLAKGAPRDDEDDRAGPDGGAGEGGDSAAGAARPQGFAALSPEEQDAWLRPFRDVVEFLAESNQRARAEVATLKLLACMGRAYYTPDNEGHFGLGLVHYAHFTSPIRRYPDLVVHRNLRWLIEGSQGAPPHPHESLGTLSDHCSDQERAADGLERRIRTACLVLASLHGDSAFSAAGARITGITPASCFVLLDNGIEARAAARDLPGGPYHVDEWESMFYHEPDAASAEDGTLWEVDGQTRLVRARLGDGVQVQLEGRNVADGKTEARVIGWG